MVATSRRATGGVGYNPRFRVMKHTGRSELIGKLLLAVLSLGVGLLAAEIILRRMYPFDSGTSFQYRIPHPTLGWETRYNNDLDGTDFLAWQQQFGSGMGAVSSPTTVVPEPSTCLLFCVGTLALFRSGRRRLARS